MHVPRVRSAIAFAPELRVSRLRPCRWFALGRRIRATRCSAAAPAAVGAGKPRLIGHDHDLEQRRERPRLGLDSSGDERPRPSVRQHDDVTQLDVRRRVLEETEVVAGVVVKAVGRRGPRLHSRGGDRAQPVNAGHMFKVSRRVLGVIAVIAIVLLVLGLATDVGLFGWVLAIILGAYVVAALAMGRRGTV